MHPTIMAGQVKLIKSIVTLLELPVGEVLTQKPVAWRIYHSLAKMHVDPAMGLLYLTQDVDEFLRNVEEAGYEGSAEYEALDLAIDEMRAANLSALIDISRDLRS